jgi:hypothetical protein
MAEALVRGKKKGLTCNFIEVLNIYLAYNYCSVKIKKGCTRIEGRLRRACGEVEKKAKMDQLIENW